jgi:hypothetical protein
VLTTQQPTPSPLDSATTAATSCYSTKIEQPTTPFDFIVTLQFSRHFGEPLLASPREGFKVLGKTQSYNNMIKYGKKRLGLQARTLFVVLLISCDWPITKFFFLFQ